MSVSTAFPEPTASPTWKEALPRLRTAVRLSTGFLLDALQAVSAGRDLTDTAVLIAIVQANVSPVLSDPGLQRAYALADQPPPDDLRRPISVNAVAASLQLPFETVRRRVRQLAQSGMCEITPQGLVVPQAPLATPAHQARLHANYMTVRQLYRDLRIAGCLPPAGGSEPEPWPAPPTRAVARLSSDYALRMVEPIVTHLGDLTDGFILLAMFYLNTRHLPLTGVVESNSDGFLPDELRRPASVAQVAGRLDLSYELVRRRLRRLEQEDRCRRMGGGFVVPAAALVRPGLAQFIVRNEANLQRLFAGVAQLGLTSAWDSELGHPQTE